MNYDYIFLSFSAKCIGSAHDSLTFSVLAHGKYLSGENLREEFWIVGDEAYVCTELLIKLVPSS